MESPVERRFVLRKKSEAPKEPPKEKLTDDAVEPERLLSVQGVDLSVPESAGKKEEAVPKETREHIPPKSSHGPAGAERSFDSKATRRGSVESGGSARYRKHKNNLADLYR